MLPAKVSSWTIKARLIKSFTGLCRIWLIKPLSCCLCVKLYWIKMSVWHSWSGSSVSSSGESFCSYLLPWITTDNVTSSLTSTSITAQLDLSLCPQSPHKEHYCFIYVNGEGSFFLSFCVNYHHTLYLGRLLLPSCTKTHVHTSMNLASVSQPGLPGLHNKTTQTLWKSYPPLCQIIFQIFQGKISIKQ